MSNIPSNNRVNSSNPNEGYMRRNISNITFDIDSLLPSEQNTFYDFSQHGHDDLIYQAEEVPNQQDDGEYEYYICKVPKNRDPSKGSPITPISNVNTVFQSIDKDQYDQCSKLIQQSMKKSRMNDNFIRSSHNLTDSKPFQSQYFTVSNKKISCEKLYHFYIQNTFYDFSQHGHDDLIYQAEEVPNQQDDGEYEYYICKVPKNRDPSKGSPITPISNVNTVFQSIDKDQYDQCSKLIQQSMKKSRMNDNFIRSSHNLTDSKPFQSQYFTVSNKKISCEKLYHFYIHPQYGQVPVIPLKIYLSNTLRLFLGDPISPDDIIIYQDSKSRENQLYLLQRRFSKSNSLLCWCNQCQCNTRAYTKLAKSSPFMTLLSAVTHKVELSFICSICDHFLGDINSYYYVLVKNSE